MLVLYLMNTSYKDHSRAAADLVRAGIDVYASAGTLAALGLSGARFHPVRAHEQIVLVPWLVYPFDAIHDVECVGFFVIAQSTRLVYLTDSAYCKYKFQGITHVMVECNYEAAALQGSDLPQSVKRRIVHSHFSLEHVLEFLKANDLSRLREVWLLHLSDANADAERFKREVQRATGVAVYVG